MATGQPLKTKATIDGTDVTDYLISWVREDSPGNNYIRSIKIVLSRSLENIIDINDASLLGDIEVVVTRGVTLSTEQYVFRGIIKNYSRLGGQITLDCLDNLYKTTKRTITYSFDKDIDTEAGVVSDIFTTLINDYTTLTADATSVQDSGTTLILSKFICKSESVYNKCKELAEALSWVFYYDPSTEKVYFEPKGFINNNTIIEEGVNLIGSPKWNSDETKIFNDVRLDGAVQEAQTKETGQIGVTSGYSTSSIQLLQVPIIVNVLCDAASPPTTEKTLGVPNSTGTYDYYVDKTKKQIIWNTGTYTPGGSDHVIITYTFIRPTPIQNDDPESIASYGLKQKSLKKDNIKEVVDAELYVTQYITDHKDPILYSTLRVTNISDLAISQQVQVINSSNNINDTFKIESIRMEYPYRDDTIKVTSDIIDEGDYLLYVDLKLKELDKRNQDDFDTLVQIKNNKDDIITEDRYLDIQKGTIDSGVLYFDNDTQGTWGNDAGTTGYNWGDDNPISVASVVIAQPNELYSELFYDTEFKQTTGFTADWDTANKDLEVADGEIALSTAITKNTETSTNNYFTKVRFSDLQGIDINNLTFQIGEDDNAAITYTTLITTGSSTLRSSVWYNLSGTNKYGINWKVTNNSGSTGTLSNINIEYDTV